MQATDDQDVAAHRITPNTLERILAGISGPLDLTFVPGNTWGYDPETRTVTFRRSDVLQPDDRIATGLVFRQAGIATESRSRTNAWTVAARIARRADRVQTAIVTPSDIVDAIATCEIIRVENVQRDRFPGLHAHDLPKPTSGYRRPLTEIWLKGLCNAEPPTDMPSVCDPSALDQKFVETATVIALLEHMDRTILPENLPEALVPDDATRAAVPVLAAATSLREIIDNIEPLVLAIAQRRTTALMPPPQSSQPHEQTEEQKAESSDEQSDGTNTENKQDDSEDESSANGSEDKSDGSELDDDADESASGDADDEKAEATGNDASESGEDQDSNASQDGDDGNQGQASSTSTTPSASGNANSTTNADGDGESQSSLDPKVQDSLSARRDASDHQAAQRADEGGSGLDMLDRSVQKLLDELKQDPSKFAPAAGDAATAHHLNNIEPWSAVATAAAPLVGALTRIFHRTLVEHRRRGKLAPLLHGSLSLRHAIADSMNVVQSGRVFAKRKIETHVDYHVHVVVDVSGSMGMIDTESQAYGNPALIAAFGPDAIAPRHIHIAKLMCVGLTVACDRFEGVSVGVSIHDAAASTIVPQRDRLTSGDREALLRRITEDGGTNHIPAWHAAAQALRTRSGPKAIFYLTDGALPNDDETQELIRSYERDGIHLVALVIGPYLSHARSVVGERNADGVTIDTLPEVLHRHLRRWMR